MDELEVEELAHLTGELTRSLRSFQLPNDSTDISSRVERILLLLQPTLEAISFQGAITESSPFLTALEQCKGAVVNVNGILDRMAVVSCSHVNEPHRWVKGVENELGEVLEELYEPTNALSLAANASSSLASKSPVSQAEVHKRAYDAMAQSVLGFASQIFPSIKRPDTSHGSLIVEEIDMFNDARSNTTGSSRIVCPSARIDRTSKKMRSVIFRCCCDNTSHDSQLKYKVFRGESLLREEICLDGSRKWSILLSRSSMPVIVRLSDIPIFYTYHVQRLADDIGMAYIAEKDNTETQRSMETKPRRFESFQSDGRFPSIKVRTVMYESAGIKRYLDTPATVVLKHYSVPPNPPTNISLGSPAPRHPLPDRFCHIMLRSSLTNKDAKKILVTIHTQISHEKNPLGRLFVTLQDVFLIGVDGSSEETKACGVHFGFDERREAECFAHYLKVSQRTLLEKLMLGPFYDEKIIYLRELHTAAVDVTEAHLQFSVVSRDLGDSKHVYRVIVKQYATMRCICFEFEPKESGIERLDLLQSRIWVYDHDEDGTPSTSQTDWETITGQRAVKLTQGTTINDHDANVKPYTLQPDWETRIGERPLKPIERATFVKSGHERTANDWLDELDKLLGVMKPDRSDRYEKVKIAVIDSGLNDAVKRRYMAQNNVVYKDFTHETHNDSWHGTCCAKIICDIYEEAVLFIARIFERDHASDEEGPIRMAKAIDWAISNRVDIISISAGFRDYSKELDEAVTRAKAAGTLVVAAAANWSNTGTVAFPARHNLTTMCIYSTNMGNQGSTFNPEPRSDTSNFAVLGEGFQHPDQRRNEQMSGTSMATAAAVGLAANIIDFSRQQDNKSYICRSQDVGKLPGMLSIFSSISRPAGPLKYVAPLDLLPANHGTNRERGRQRVREILSQAMEKAN